MSKSKYIYPLLAIIAVIFAIPSVASAAFDVRVIPQEFNDGDWISVVVTGGEPLTPVQLRFSKNNDATIGNFLCGGDGWCYDEVLGWEGSYWYAIQSAPALLTGRYIVEARAGSDYATFEMSVDGKDPDGPSVPVGVTATTQCDSSDDPYIDLSWSSSSEGDHFHIKRCSGSSSCNVGSSDYDDTSGNSYFDNNFGSGLSQNTWYKYTISGHDHVNNIIGGEQPVSIKTNDCRPTGPSCTAVAFNAATSGYFKNGSKISGSSNIKVGQSYKVRCDFGIRSDNISVDGCTSARWQGNAREFDCPAPTTSGIVNRSPCRIAQGGSGNICQDKTGSIGSLSVIPVSGPPPPPPPLGIRTPDLQFSPDPPVVTAGNTITFKAVGGDPFSNAELSFTEVGACNTCWFVTDGYDKQTDSNGNANFDVTISSGTPSGNAYARVRVNGQTSVTKIFSVVGSSAPPPPPPPPPPPLQTPLNEPVVVPIPNSVDAGTNIFFQVTSAAPNSLIELRITDMPDCASCWYEIGTNLGFIWSGTTDSIGQYTFGHGSNAIPIADATLTGEYFAQVRVNGVTRGTSFRVNGKSFSGAPSLVSGFSATASCDGATARIGLRWNGDTIDGVTDYHLERCAGDASCTDFSPQSLLTRSNTGGSMLVYDNIGISDLTTYRHRIRAHRHQSAVGDEGTSGPVDAISTSLLCDPASRTPNLEVLTTGAIAPTSFVTLEITNGIPNGSIDIELSDEFGLWQGKSSAIGTVDGSGTKRFTYDIPWTFQTGPHKVRIWVSGVLGSVARTFEVDASTQTVSQFTPTLTIDPSGIVEGGSFILRVTGAEPGVPFEVRRTNKPSANPSDSANWTPWSGNSSFGPPLTATDGSWTSNSLTLTGSPPGAYFYEFRTPSNGRSARATLTSRSGTTPGGILIGIGGWTVRADNTSVPVPTTVSIGSITRYSNPTYNIGDLPAGTHNLTVDIPSNMQSVRHGVCLASGPNCALDCGGGNRVWGEGNSVFVNIPGCFAHIAWEFTPIPGTPTPVGVEVCDGALGVCSPELSGTFQCKDASTRLVCVLEDDDPPGGDGLGNYCWQIAGEKGNGVNQCLAGETCGGAGQCIGDSTPSPNPPTRFSRGSSVETKGISNIRSSPGGRLIGGITSLVTGTIREGPIWAKIFDTASQFYWWWEVNFPGTATDGWIADSRLQVPGTPAAPVYVNGGPNTRVILPRVAQLKGIARSTVNDVDVPGGYWTSELASQPGTVSFGGDTSGTFRGNDVVARFPQVGVYKLSFCHADAIPECDEVNIDVRTSVTSIDTGDGTPAGGIQSEGGKYVWFPNCSNISTPSGLRNVSSPQNEVILSIESSNPRWLTCLSENAIEFTFINYAERWLSANKYENLYKFLGIPEHQKDYIPTYYADGWQPVSELVQGPGVIASCYGNGRNKDGNMVGYAKGWWGLANSGRSNPDNSTPGANISETGKCIPDFRDWQPGDPVPAYTGGPHPNAWEGSCDFRPHQDPTADEINCADFTPDPRGKFGRGANIYALVPVNVYDGPSTAFNLVGTKPAGATANVNSNRAISDGAGNFWSLVSFFDDFLAGYVNERDFILERDVPIVPDPPKDPDVFNVNDRIELRQARNVREGAGTQFPLVNAPNVPQPVGALGTVRGGPTRNGSFDWYNIDFDNSRVDGWIAGVNTQGANAMKHSSAQAPTPQCSDGLDNDSDGFIDIFDPGCHTDGDASNASSYDQQDTDEVDSTAPPEPGGSGIFMVRGTFLGDLDRGVEVTDRSDTSGDFEWRLDSPTTRALAPARLSSVTLAVINKAVVTRDDCVSASLSSNAIDGSGTNYGSMPVGTKFCALTNEGLYSTFQITNIDTANNHKLTISYTTWPNPVTTTGCSTAFALDDVVAVTGTDGIGANVRSTPGGTDIGSAADGDQGTIKDAVSRPAAISGQTYCWWNVDFGFIEGWVAEELLIRVGGPDAGAPTCSGIIGGNDGSVSPNAVSLRATGVQRATDVKFSVYPVPLSGAPPPPANVQVYDGYLFDTLSDGEQWQTRASDNPTNTYLSTPVNVSSTAYIADVWLEGSIDRVCLKVGFTINENSDGVRVIAHSILPLNPPYTQNPFGGVDPTPTGPGCFATPDPVAVNANVVFTARGIPDSQITRWVTDGGSDPSSDATPTHTTSYSSLGEKTAILFYDDGARKQVSCTVLVGGPDVGIPREYIDEGGLFRINDYIKTNYRMNGREGPGLSFTENEVRLNADSPGKLVSIHPVKVDGVWWWEFNWARRCSERGCGETLWIAETDPNDGEALFRLVAIPDCTTQGRVPNPWIDADGDGLNDDGTDGWYFGDDVTCTSCALWDADGTYPYNSFLSGPCECSPNPTLCEDLDIQRECPNPQTKPRWNDTDGGWFKRSGCGCTNWNPDGTSRDAAFSDAPCSCSPDITGCSTTSPPPPPPPPGTGGNHEDPCSSDSECNAGLCCVTGAPGTENNQCHFVDILHGGSCMGGSSSETYSVGDRVSYSAGGSGAFVYNQAARTEQLGVNNSNGTVKFVSPDTNSIGIDFDSNFYSQTQDDNPDGWVNEDVFQLGGGTAPAPKFSDGDTIEVNTLAEICLSVRTFADADTSAIDCMPVGSRGSIKGTIRGPEDGHMWWEVNFDDMTIDGFSAEYYLDKVGGGTTPFVFSSGSFMVRGTFNVDMDLGVEGPAVADADFKWDIQSSTQRYLNPSPNVTMAVVPGTQVPDYNDCVNANLSSANIIGDDPNYSSMPVGTHICVKTNEDRYSTFTITDIDAATNHKLTISYTTWAKATDPPPVTAQCSDGLDNDSDGFVDTADPGCHSDGNAANAGSYNPNDDDETDLAGISFTKHIISTNVDSATGVYAIDLDGDGDNDVLSASYSDDTVAWYENDGSEGFTKHVITTSASSVRTVHAADIDGDGDIDVIAAVYDDDKIEWYENNGSENFTTHEVVTTSGSPMRDAFAIDVDGDGDIDIVSASINSDAIAWSENDGNQNFTRHVVTPFTSGGSSVHAIDVEGDGDVDILSALQFGNTIAWYENDGSQNFTSLNIDTNADGAISVHAVDVDSDGDIDVLAASHADHTVAWHENDGSQNFTKHSLNPSVGRSNYVSSVDIDGDGDIDILSSSAVGDTFEWYENDGSQVFANHVIDSSADGASSPFPIDLDGDGDIDIVAAMFLEDVVVWYEQTGGTQLPSPQCSDNIDNDGDGLIDSADPGCHTNLDAGNAGTYDGNDNDELNLKQTDLIKISGTPGTDNLRVRTGPFIPTTNPNSNVLETLNAGEVGTIVGGPSGPTNGFLWWQVDFLALASNGWVVQDFIELAPEAAADLAPGDTIIINPTNQDNGAPVYPAPVVDAATIIGYQSLAQATVTVDPITGEFFQFATPNSWHYLDFADDTIDGWVIDDFYRVDQIFPNQANNKSFEAISGGLPEGWTFESAECTGSVSSLNARLGNNSAMITCPATGGTGKFVQTFNGNAGSAYELIGFAKTVGTFGSPGADDVGASMTLEPAPQSEQRDNIQGEGDNGEHRILNNYVLASALGGADTIPMRLVLRFHSLPGPTESKAWFDDVQLIGGVFFGGTPEFSNGDRVEVAAGRVKVRSEGRYPTIFTIDDSDSDNVIAVLPAKTAGAIIDGPIQEVIDPDNFWWKVDFDNPDATDGWVEERALNVENTKTHYFSGTLTDAAPSATPSIQVNNTTGAIDAVLEWHPSVEGRSHNFRFMLYRPGVTPEPLQPSAAFDDDNNRHHPKRVKYILGSDPADAVGTWNFYIENNTGQSASEYTLSVTYPGVVDVNPSTQCSDGLDNDGDGTIDILDRGCHMDGDASNTVSYNPSDNTEFGEPLLPVDLVVTVLPMTSAHPQSTLGGGPNGFVVDGVEGKELTLERGGTYNFNVTTDGSHIFYLTHSQIGASIDPITAGVTGTGGGIGVSNGTLTFRPDENTPDEIYYGCSIHGRMGWQIHVVDPPIVSSGDISQDALANTLSGLETLLRELRKRINSL